MIKRFLALIILITLLLVIIPAFVLLIFNQKPNNQKEILGTPIRVYNHELDELMIMDLEEYLVGVVAQEMPASFNEEALKAQALAARTYAYKRILQEDPLVQKAHPDAQITTNPAISQAWVSNEGMRQKWGLWNYQFYRKKIADAVESTKGEIILYQGQPIDPLYHASCGGGMTENSEEVWKNPFPYLVSVQCADHLEGYYQDQKTIPIKELDKLMGTDLAKKKDIRVLSRSAPGRIKEIEINGKSFLGTELRSKLSLRSTWFTWEITGDQIVFTTRGYGHGVGMCQYGANHLAEEGKTYQEIIKHYYRGVDINIMDNR